MSTQQLVFWVAFFEMAAIFSAVASCVFFFANLKLYTEIMKEKSQRERRP